MLEVVFSINCKLYASKHASTYSLFAGTFILVSKSTIVKLLFVDWYFSYSLKCEPPTVKIHFKHLRKQPWLIIKTVWLGFSLCHSFNSLITSFTLTTHSSYVSTVSFLYHPLSSSTLFYSLIIISSTSFKISFLLRPGNVFPFSWQP